MDKWMDRPPAPCHRTGRDEPQSGNPFYVEDFHYAEIQRHESGQIIATPRVKPLVTSASQIRAACEAPGSPFKLLTLREWDEVAETTAERDELQMRVEELESELELLRQAPGVDVQALAGALVIPLSDHFSRKPGPKPRAA